MEKGEGEGGLNERAGLGLGRGRLRVLGALPVIFAGPSTPRGCGLWAEPHVPALGPRQSRTPPPLRQTSALSAARRRGPSFPYGRSSSLQLTPRDPSGVLAQPSLRPPRPFGHSTFAPYLLPLLFLTSCGFSSFL